MAWTFWTGPISASFTPEIPAIAWDGAFSPRPANETLRVTCSFPAECIGAEVYTNVSPVDFADAGGSVTTTVTSTSHVIEIPFAGEFESLFVWGTVYGGVTILALEFGSGGEEGFWTNFNGQLEALS